MSVNITNASVFRQLPDAMMDYVHCNAGFIRADNLQSTDCESAKWSICSSMMFDNLQQSTNFRTNNSNKASYSERNLHQQEISKIYLK